MDSIAERLRWARERQGKWRTPSDAARAYGWTLSTYFGHENGDRNPSREAAKRYARAYKVRWEWLLEGEGAPDLNRTVVDLAGYISAGGSIDTSSEQDDPNGGFEVELMAQVPEAAVAYQVVGNSMYPQYKPDTVIICGPHTTDARLHIGEDVAVGTPDGNRYLKTLREGAEPGRYDLESHNAPLMRNTEIAWIAPIVAIIPPRQWKRIQKA